MNLFNAARRNNSNVVQKNNKSPVSNHKEDVAKNSDSNKKNFKI